MKPYRFTVKDHAAVTEILGDLDPWAYQCHAASIAIVRAEHFPQARVARGRAFGVVGQHSWVVIGDDVYEPRAIIDPTLWSYVDDVEGVLYLSTKRDMRTYVPKGSGSIWLVGCPRSMGGPEIELEGLSATAERFLGMCRTAAGSLDRTFWAGLLNGPMGGWPSREIVAVTEAHPDLSPLIPIDIVGHLTDVNPEGLYLPASSVAKHV